jgi:K+-transporting ATPase ATPase C chain
MLLRQTLYHFALLTLITGLLYPLTITALASQLFPKQANGDPALIGRHFDQPHYFWPRPSATSPTPYNAASSSGSNLGPLHPDLKKAIAERRAKYDAQPPIDLLTSSASGLDPHISPEAAYFQAARVANARHLPIAQVTQLITELTEPRQLGFLGEPRVNVLNLNRRLDQQR